jgi:hypothetical protein
LKLKNEKVEFPFFPLPSLCFFVGARENQKSPPLIFGFIDWTVEPKTIIRTTTATRTTTIESKIQSKKKKFWVLVLDTIENDEKLLNLSPSETPGK